MAAIVKIYPDVEILVEEAAAEICQAIDRAVQHRGMAVVFLSGGRTPLPVYRRLALPPWSRLMPWAKIHLFWSDERWVAPDHKESNFGMAWQALLSKVPIPKANVHRICTGGLNPMDAAEEYELELRKFLSGHGEIIDLAIMGMGDDGHTASLFPGSQEVQEKLRYVTTAKAPAGIKERITVTLPLLNKTEEVLFLVTGSDKHRMLERILRSEDADRFELPAAKVKAVSQITWMLDKRAAGLQPEVSQQD